MFLPVLLGTLATKSRITASILTAATAAVAAPASVAAISAGAAVASLAVGGVAGAVALGAASMMQLTKTSFNTVEAMQILGLSKPTILKKLKNKELNFEGSGGKGGYKISKKDIEKYARLHKIEPDWSNFIRKEPTKEELEIQTKALADVENNPEMLAAMIKIIEADKKELELMLKILNLDDDSVKSKREHQMECIETEQMINEYDRIINAYKIRLIKLKAKGS